MRGIITDIANHPLNAIVRVLNHDTLHSEIRTDSMNGNYHRMLASGVYSFLFSAEGYFTQTINNVSVSNFQTTLLNVELIPNPVPVERISFIADLSENEVTLSWQTATENNNKGFAIERSWDNSKFEIRNLNFEKIGFVQGNGSTTEFHSYIFTDKNVEPGFYQCEARYCQLFPSNRSSRRPTGFPLAGFE